MAVRAEKTKSSLVSPPCAARPGPLTLPVLRQVLLRLLRFGFARRFGIGIHHAGLNAKDRGQVEELFCEGKIQIP